jgi:hypothetical protein
MVSPVRSRELGEAVRNPRRERNDNNALRNVASSEAEEKCVSKTSARSPACSWHPTKTRGKRDAVAPFYTEKRNSLKAGLQRAAPLKVAIT